MFLFFIKKVEHGTRKPQDSFINFPVDVYGYQYYLTIRLLLTCFSKQPTANM